MSYQQERVPLDASSSYFLPSASTPNGPDNRGVLCAVGVYIAAASFYFVVVFGADVLNRYVQGKPWYPNKYIPLNAISLTVLTIAIKIPTDLTTTMDEWGEQLSKLTGSVLVCILIANTMPSLGGMDGASTIVANVGALVVTIVTLIVDLSIQIKTKILHVVWREQIVIMVIMFLQLLFVVSTALVVPTTKELMERQFQAKHNQQSEENISAEEKEGVNYVSKIKENIVRYWFMAHSSNPQYVVARSPTCIASGGLCLVTVGAMIVAILRTISYAFDDNQPKTKSGYYFSVVITIVFIQMFAIILGIIGPASRCMWWSEVVFKNCCFCTNWEESIKNIIINNDCFKVEAYWVSSLVKWKDAPLCMNLKGTLTRKIIRFFKRCVLTLLVKMQMVIVIVSKLIRAVSVVPMLPFHKILQLILHRYFFHPATISILIYLKIIKDLQLLIYLSPYFFTFFTRSYLFRLKKKFHRDRLRIMDEHQHSISSNYVLHLEGETELVNFITEDSRNNGRNDKNKNKKKEKEKNAMLIQLIKNYATLMEGSKFVTDFRANTRSSSHPDLLRCSWALPLVTLSCITVTLPRVDRRPVELLLEAVNRGLKFVRLIEQSIDDSLLINMREAAEFVWLGVDLDSRWFDFQLPTFLRSEELNIIAKNHILEFRNRAEADVWNRPYEWPPKVLAADCMQTVCTTILLNYDQYGTNMMLFNWLRRTISDLLGACLTNLPEVIHMECSKKSIEVREEGVLNAANLFAETEDLLMFLYNPVVASNFPERKKNIEEWESRGVVVATDISAMEDSSVHSERLDGVVIEVDTASEHISGVQRM